MTFYVENALDASAAHSSGNAQEKSHTHTLCGFTAGAEEEGR